MNSGFFWWMFGCFLLVNTDVSWAEVHFPWDRLEEAVVRYGMMEKMLCEDTACVVTWNRSDIDSFDKEYCSLKIRNKRVVCRYLYDFL